MFTHRLLEVRRALERVLLDVVRRVGRGRRVVVVVAAGVVLVAQVRVDAGHELLQRFAVLLELGHDRGAHVLEVS